MKQCHTCTAQIASPYFAWIERKKVPMCPACFEEWMRREVQDENHERQLQVKRKEQSRGT